LARIEPAKLAGSLSGWLFEVKLEAGFLVNIDGKTMRGSIGAGIKGFHIVSAWVGAQNLTLGQVRTSEHSNEITAIPELLDSIDIKGGRVTIDAMGCQKAIAAKVVEKGADYVLAVKENQPELCGQIRDFFEWTEKDRQADIAVEKWKSGSEKEHGRIERRECFVTDEIDWLYSKSEWANIKSVIKYRCHCIKKDQTGENWLPETVYDRYFISSMDLGAEEMYEIIRKHWGIENNLHWMLDMAFGEDADQKKTCHAPENMNILRKAALSRINAHRSGEKESVKRCKLKALMHDDYRLSLIFDP
jgi:predicted transposase YbfD/YdcC